MLTRLLRTLRTVRYLKPAQLYWFVRRRVIKTQFQATSLPVLISARSWAWPLPLQRDSGEQIDTVSFCFLNIDKQFSAGAMNWAPQDVNRLWRYNLHYFDFLLDEQRPLAEKNALMLDWIRQNLVGSEPAWEPYTASLRIVNWCKWLSVRPFGDADQDFTEVCRSLYEQALWLENNLELHILANHYLENLKALIFAGTLFSGSDAARWLTLGLAEMRVQLDEQILPDGCHYERTPQYHCVILDDVLDLLQLTQLTPDVFAADFVDLLRVSAVKMAAFLADILNPLDQYPLFNDSAFYDDCPTDILQRATDLGVVYAKPASSARLIQRHDAGFYGYRAGGDWIMFDCGEIGPDYQPGHTHCDFLSYELVIDHIPVVVDTGVLEYEPGAMRHYVRQTSSHNTVQVDDAEQSEVWGEFRVARRASKEAAFIQFGEQDVEFQGSFFGFHAAGGVMHKRRVTITCNADRVPTSWQFNDQLIGKGRHRVRSFMHLHPEITPSLENDGVYLRYRDKCLAVVCFDAGLDIRLEDAVYCPQFGLKQHCQKIVMERELGLPAQLGYLIIRKDL